jgi:hypothetical protein
MRYMTTVTFDTLELTRTLKDAGIPSEQAEAVVRVIAQAQDKLVTEDILENRLASLKADLLVLKWMMGFLLAGMLSLLTKTFL